MRIGSLFSGIGGLELGLEMAGMGRVAWQSETDPFRRRVLEQHWPFAQRFGDIRGLGRSNLPLVDVICGGFPCQDVSQARGRAGWKPLEESERSGLWKEFRRIVKELLPGIVIVENVYSGKERWLPQVRRDLHLLGYRNSAFTISAAEVGANHQRKRIFVVAYSYPNRESASALNAEAPKLPSDAGGLWNRRIPPPERRRMDDGVPRGLDRLRALGDAVVPQCAAAVGRMMLDDLSRKSNPDKEAA